MIRMVGIDREGDHVEARIRCRVYDGDHTVEMASAIDAAAIRPFMHARYDG